MKRLLLIFMLVGCGSVTKAESVTPTPVKPTSTRVTVIKKAPPTTVKTPPPFNMGDFIVLNGYRQTTTRFAKRTSSKCNSLAI